MSSFAGQIATEIDPKTFYQDSGIVNIDVLLPVFGIGALAYLGLFVLFSLREFLIYTLIFIGPIGIALSFSGIPVLEDYARNAMSRFVPLVLLPIPAAVVFRAMSFFLDNLSGTAITQLKIGVELMIGAAPLVAFYLCWKSFKLTNPLVGGLVDSTASVATGGIKKTGRGAAAVGATATLGPATGLATATGGVKGGARHQALRMGMSGRREDPDPSESTSDDVGEFGSVRTSPSGPSHSGSTVSRAGPGQPQGAVGGATYDQPAIPPSGDGVGPADGDSPADYIDYGESHFDGPVERPSGSPYPSGLPPHRVDGKTHSERRLDEYDEPESRSPSTGVSSGGSPAGIQGGRQYDSRRRPQGVYYDPDHGIRKGTLPPEQRGAAGAGRGRAVDADGDDEPLSGRRGTAGPAGQSSQQAQTEILRAIRANLEQQSSEQGGSDVVDVDSRVTDTDTGGGARDDDTDTTSRGA